MRTIIKVLALFFTVQAGAQNPVINIEDQNGKYLNGAYYRDTNNYLDPFVGTWIYTNGNTSLTIVLEKKIQAFNTQYYEDLLIGEYRYVSNGNELINTLPEISNVYPNQRKHNVQGNSVLDNEDIPRCPECNPGEKRVRFGFIDPVADIGGNIYARLITVNGQPAMKVFRKAYGKTYAANNPPAYLAPIVPPGEYILVKQ